jgi:hypothetical protein
MVLIAGSDDRGWGLAVAAMRLSFEAVEEQVSLEISSSELTRERLAN